MREIRALTFVLALALMLAGCGGGGGNGSPTAPSVPQIPNVAGSYTGTTTVTFPELSETVTCPTTTTVTQSGSTVNVAPLVMGGTCDGLSVPLGQTTIDSTGAITGGNTTFTFNEPSCGNYNVTASGGFFGRELRISMVAVSATCYDFNLTITLTR